jgi:hypothetical protein
LLTDPEGKVRDYLPLFNFWGVESAQSMAVVSPEWKYIYWYYGGDGMEPAEELFHLTQDPIEMYQIALSRNHKKELKTMRKFYNLELDLITKNVFQDHGYMNYPVLFNRKISWNKKSPLLESLSSTTIRKESE